MSEKKELHKKVEQACWGVLGAIQLLPLVVKIPVGVQLLVNSCVVVILGALKSVDLATKTEEENRLQRVDLKTEGQQDEFLGQKDALMFPITASFSLFGLYILFTYINKELIKSLLKVYFSFLGMYAVGLGIAELLIERDATLSRVTYERKFGFKIPYIMDEPFSIKMRKADNYGFAVGFAMAAVYCLTSHWLLNNIFGITFTIGGIRLLKISNIKTGLIMLWGLFLYDIFWVFKTDVMITVAKSVDGPILLKFPVDVAASKFSMLGLGDMIVPGVFASLMLKFDLDNFLSAFKTTDAAQIKTPYFWYQVLFYFIGIATTFVFMFVFEHPQPALLYLVPAATIGLLIPALQEKDRQKLLTYTATEEEKKQEEKKQE